MRIKIMIGFHPYFFTKSQAIHDSTARAEAESKLTKEISKLVEKAISENPFVSKETLKWQITRFAHSKICDWEFFQAEGNQLHKKETDNPEDANKFYESLQESANNIRDLFSNKKIELDQYIKNLNSKIDQIFVEKINESNNKFKTVIETATELYIKSGKDLCILHNTIKLVFNDIKSNKFSTITEETKSKIDAELFENLKTNSCFLNYLSAFKNNGIKSMEMTMDLIIKSTILNFLEAHDIKKMPDPTTIRKIKVEEIIQIMNIYNKFKSEGNANYQETYLNNLILDILNMINKLDDKNRAETLSKFAYNPPSDDHSSIDGRSDEFQNMFSVINYIKNWNDADTNTDFTEFINSHLNESKNHLVTRNTIQQFITVKCLEKKHLISKANYNDFGTREDEITRPNLGEQADVSIDQGTMSALDSQQQNFSRILSQANTVQDVDAIEGGYKAKVDAIFMSKISDILKSHRIPNEHIQNLSLEDHRMIFNIISNFNLELTEHFIWTSIEKIFSKCLGLHTYTVWNFIAHVFSGSLEHATNWMDRVNSKEFQTKVPKVAIMSRHFSELKELEEKNTPKETLRILAGNLKLAGVNVSLEDLILFESNVFELGNASSLRLGYRHPKGYDHHIKSGYPPNMAIYRGQTLKVDIDKFEYPTRLGRFSELIYANLTEREVLLLEEIRGVFWALSEYLQLLNVKQITDLARLRAQKKSGEEINEIMTQNPKIKRDSRAVWSAATEFVIARRKGTLNAQLIPNPIQIAIVEAAISCGYDFM